MNLSLKRFAPLAGCTFGSLYVDGQFQCFTLELPVGDGGPGSAIPAGTYPVILAPSIDFASSGDPFYKNFAYAMPHLTDVPGRTAIMIHPGNSASDTKGCILVGQSDDLQDGELWNSRPAFESLYMKIKPAIDSGEGCTIEVQ